MTKQDAREEFRRVYPEREVYINSIEDLGNDKFLLAAKFPEAIFYFIIEEDTVSNSYDTEEQAKRSIRSFKFNTRRRLIAAKKFTPDIDEVYTNVNGSKYKCLEIIKPYSAVMQQVESKWTCECYDICQYDDDTIEWSYSIHGYFDK